MADDALESEINRDVQHRYERGTPYSSKDLEGMSDKEYRIVLAESAKLQRDRPETAMLAIQRKLGSGVYSHAVEHTGDLYHRSHEHVFNTSHGWDLVDPKVSTVLRSLTHKYGFEREMKENLVSNAKFYNDPSITWDAAVVLGRDYAHEHSLLPVYNYPAHLMTQAAQHLGHMRFGAATATLQQLEPHLENPENWKNLHSRQASIEYLKSQGR